jgi:hypothetical protein
MKKKGLSMYQCSAKTEARTCIDGCEGFERVEQEHGDDAHAKDLNTAAGHVKHESLHRKRLGRRDGEVPCTLLLQTSIRSRDVLGGFGGGTRLRLSESWRVRN